MNSKIKLLILLITFNSILIPISCQFTADFTVKDDSPLRSLLEFPMESEIDTKTILHTCLGTPAQCFDLIIQTNSFYIMVPDAESPSQQSRHKYDSSKSLTSVRSSRLITFEFYSQNFKGQEASDIITLGDQKLNRTNFLIISASGKFRYEDGFIGLGYTPSSEEKKFSIIQQLYESGTIPHKVFSQKYTDGYNGKITFGEIPKHIVKDYTHYGRCRAINKIKKNKEYKNNNWECFIDFINYGSSNESDDVKKAKNVIKSFIDSDPKEEVLFLSYRKRSFLPYDLFNKFGDTYLNKFLENKKCNIGEQDRYTFYECDMDVELEPLNFMFEGWEIRFESKQLFSDKKKANNKKEFIFYYKKKYEKILFGRSILKELEMVYDYANKQIGFYHQNVSYLGKEKVVPPKVYEFLYDDTDYKEKNVKKPSSLIPDSKPDEGLDKKYETVEQDGSTHLSQIFKVIFEVLIFVFGIILIGFLFIYAMKVRRKNFIKKANMHLKKQRLLEMK